jgi:uridine kinase
MLIIGIAGGSGSGKTTVVQALETHFRSQPVIVLPQDCYYKDHGHLSAADRLEVNFDHPGSVDFELLLDHVNKLKRGLPIDRPSYSYITCSRLSDTTRINPAEVMIIEGILVYNREDLREMMDIKVYVDADADDRLARIIERDTRERARELEQVLERYFQMVKPMHLQFIEPCKRYADIIIPGGGQNRVAVDAMVSIIDRQLKSGT